MTENLANAWDIRERMGMELFNKIKSHPQKGKWQEGFAATSLMLNSASHGDGERAIEMIVEDTLSAYNRQSPIDIVKFALKQVVEFRKILIDTQARRDGPVEGEITLEILKEKLKNELPGKYFEELFK